MNEWFIRYCSIAAGLYIMSIYMYIYIYVCVKNIKIYKKWHAISSVHELGNNDAIVINSFLADRTNGRAIATLLRPSSSSSSSSVTLCIVAKRCVLEQKLLLRAYRKSYMRNRLVPK